VLRPHSTLTADSSAVRPRGRLPTRLVVPADGPRPSPSWSRRRQAGAAAVLTGRAICVPFRARRLRFVTVNHGHSRSSDLQAPYYRCAATRTVRTGSPARFRQRLLRWRFRLVGSDRGGLERRRRPRPDGTGPRSVLGPCRTRAPGARAVTSGLQGTRRIAGRRLSSSSSRHEASGHIRLWVPKVIRRTGHGTQGVIRRICGGLAVPLA
jgi:hypothetical protein